MLITTFYNIFTIHLCQIVFYCKNIVSLWCEIGAFITTNKNRSNI